LALLAKTRERLAAEGLFDSARKRPLPYLPRRIGVVTSPTGAVIRDILHRLADRFPSHVVVWPVPVQGQGAAEQVANAVRGFSAMQESERPDLVIVARGGGSIEDLWAFNEEMVVRAIAECRVPVISAVGHETDTTLAYFAADLRAPTPTAAAELAVPVREELIAQLADLALRKRKCALRPVTLGRERLAARGDRLPRAEALLAAKVQQLDDTAERLRRGLGQRIVAAERTLRADAAQLSAGLLRERLRRAEDRLGAVRLRTEPLTRHLTECRRRVDQIERLRLQLDPKAPLRRGYVLVTGPDGALVSRRAEAASLPTLTLEFGDGKLSVSPAGIATARPARRPASSQKQSPPGQGKLL
jgi:exodeoxyribonuclease VII large subunit